MKGALLFITLLFVSSILALTDKEYQDAFLGWMQQHNKVYSSAEFTGRYNTFKANLDYVNEWNAQNTATVRMFFSLYVSLLCLFVYFVSLLLFNLFSCSLVGATYFADLTNEEYRATYLGTHFDGTSRLASSAKVYPLPHLTLDDVMMT